MAGEADTLRRALARAVEAGALAEARGLITALERLEAQQALAARSGSVVPITAARPKRDR